jgi:hypothetical protein
MASLVDVSYTGTMFDLFKPNLGDHHSVQLPDFNDFNPATLDPTGFDSTSFGFDPAALDLDLLVLLIRSGLIPTLQGENLIVIPAVIGLSNWHGIGNVGISLRGIILA